MCAVCGDGMEAEVATWKINKGTEVIQQEDYKNLVPEERSERKMARAKLNVEVNAEVSAKGRCDCCCK